MRNLLITTNAVTPTKIANPPVKTVPAAIPPPTTEPIQASWELIKAAPERVLIAVPVAAVNETPVIDGQVFPMETNEGLPLQIMLSQLFVTVTFSICHMLRLRAPNNSY